MVFLKKIIFLNIYYRKYLWCQNCSMYEFTIKNLFNFFVDLLEKTRVIFQAETERYL